DFDDQPDPRGQVQPVACHPERRYEDETEHHRRAKTTQPAERDERRQQQAWPGERNRRKLMGLEHVLPRFVDVAEPGTDERQHPTPEPRHDQRGQGRDHSSTSEDSPRWTWILDSGTNPIFW